MQVFKAKITENTIFLLTLTLVMINCIAASSSFAQTYTNEAKKQGVKVSFYDSVSGKYGSGVSFYDFNNDGWDDLTFSRVKDSFVFYKNDSGTFKQLISFVSKTDGVYCRHLHWVDYNNDGEMDLFITRDGKTNLLYKNTGNLNFKDVSSKAGLTYKNNTFGVSFVDYNKDGYLDFYLANYENISGNSDTSKFNKLYRNNGNGTFTDVTLKAGVGDGNKPSYQGVWFDYNRDGWPDLYVINDLANYGNALYRNEGNDSFKEVTDSANVYLYGQEPMSNSVEDFNNDGYLDVYNSNTALGNPDEMNGKLLVNQKNHEFKESAKKYGVNIKKWSWGSLWIDYDNDTYRDLYVTTAEWSAPFNDYKNKLYVNKKGDSFETSQNVFLDSHQSRSHAPAKGDIDNDGFPDILVQNNHPKESFLWKNSGDSNHYYLKVTLEGTTSNRMAISSWIRIYIDTHKYVKYTKCGQNYLSQNSQHKIFGLDTFTKVDSLEVEYLSGHTDKYYNLSADTHYYFKEGETLNKPLDSFKRLCKRDTMVLDGGNYDSFRWSTGDTTQKINIHKPGTYWVVAYNKHNVKISDTIKIKQYPKIQEKVTSVKCYGENNGGIQLNTDSIPANKNYAIKWENYPNRKHLDSLQAGKHYYTFKDSSGCQFKDTIQVKQPQPLSIQKIISFNKNKKDSAGILDLSINGGTPGYEVFLDGKKKALPVKGLPRDTYALVVKDSQNCKLKDEATISYHAIPSIKVEKKQLSCPGASNGSINLIIDTLTNTDFDIIWGNGKTGPTLNNLSAGQYIYGYTDNHGTQFKDTVYLKEPDPIEVKTKINHQLPDQLGSIELKVKGGTNPYTITLKGDTVGTSIDSLQAGDYNFTIIDSNNCKKSLNVTIDNKKYPDIKHKVTHVSCNGRSDGIIKLDVNSLPNTEDSLVWENGSEKPFRNNLAAGTYTYQYFNNWGVHLKDTVKVTEPDPLNFDKQIKTDTVGDGCQVNLQIEGGTRPYQVTMDNKKRNLPITDLDQGYHNLAITDANGCQLDTSVQASGNHVPAIYPEVENPSCHDSKDGSILLEFQNQRDSSDFVKWNNGSKGRKRTNLNAGTYFYNYIASPACSVKDSVKVEAPYPLKVHKQINHAKEDDWGSLRLIIKGGTSPYEVFINKESEGTFIDSLKAGDYGVKVIDANGCKLRDSVTIKGGGASYDDVENAKPKLILEPNPVKSGNAIYFKNFSMKGKTHIEILDDKGIKVYESNWKNQGKTTFMVNTAGWSPGIYLINVRNASDVITKKVLVQ